MATRQVSPERKAIYYAGMAIGVVGILLFLSVFVSGAMNFGNFDHFNERVRSDALRAISGMAMMMVGGVIAGIGRMGPAGSGVVLDPEAARRDVEPWARMSGGVLKDTLDEAGIRFGQGAGDAKLPFDERLRRLQKLRQDGLISEAEFEETRKRILESA